MTRQSVSKHLAILEDASLVTTVRRGRENITTSRPNPSDSPRARFAIGHDVAADRASSEVTPDV